MGGTPVPRGSPQLGDFSAEPDAELLGGHAGMLLEEGGKGGGIVEAEGAGHLSDGVGGIGQQQTGVIQLLLLDVLLGGDTEILLEDIGG